MSGTPETPPEWLAPKDAPQPCCDDPCPMSGTHDCPTDPKKIARCQSC